MTIDTAWLCTFKEEIPCAFTDTCSIKPTAVFSDGQIRLMQSPPKRPQTWDEYIYNRFVKHYDYYLKLSGTVVVAFDNYQYVPPAKCMTQIARRKHTPPVAFRLVGWFNL